MRNLKKEMGCWKNYPKQISIIFTKKAEEGVFLKRRNTKMEFQDMKHRIGYWNKSLENTENELRALLKKRDEIRGILNHLKKLEAEKNDG